ncbi:ATP-dependent chaperone protein ClpB [Escherichia coli]|nr:ATP-dependent chaperone protein ClpB [Escherichia coli]
MGNISPFTEHGLEILPLIFSVFCELLPFHIQQNNFIKLFGSIRFNPLPFEIISRITIHLSHVPSTIAATTWSEYKKYFEKDAALSRRFQLVKVSEPNAAEATIILRGLSAVYEQSHGVLIDDDALQAAATLSERYLSGRQLPDKAIDVLDTACARVAINLSSPPKQISALTTLSHQQEAEIRQLERELRIGLRTDTSRIPAQTMPPES